MKVRESQFFSLQWCAFHNSKDQNYTVDDKDLGEVLHKHYAHNECLHKAGLHNIRRHIV